MTKANIANTSGMYLFKLFIINNRLYSLGYKDSTNHNKDKIIAKVKEKIVGLFLKKSYLCVHKKHLEIT